MVSEVEVFKTNVKDSWDAHWLVGKVEELFPQGIINFDLEDCDKILRVENASICTEKIISLLRVLGYSCEVLD